MHDRLPRLTQGNVRPKNLALDPQGREYILSIQLPLVGRTPTLRRVSGKAVHRRLIPHRVPISGLDASESVASFQVTRLPYSREQAVEEACRCIQCARPWCVEACPIGQDCRLYLKQIAEGDFEGAAETILRDNPLASCLGQVCYSYCEAACVIKKKGDPIAIRHLKRAALAYGEGHRLYPPLEQAEGVVAVVGSGPAGMTAAWYLAQRRYRVTVFESSEHLGGLMAGSIPPFRLGQDAFHEDLARLQRLNIRYRGGVVIGRDVKVEELFELGYEAVFMGLGTHRPRRLGLPGEDLDGVHPALNFLKGVVRNERPEMVGTVAIIGGGDVAMDSARTALRLGARRVVVLYRRTEDEMPASEEEREDARTEGVEFLFLVSPLSFRGEGRVEEVDLQEMELGPPDASGRARPVPKEGRTRTLAVTSVLVAVGQEAELEAFQDLEIQVAGDGSPRGDPDTGGTAMKGVFAGGGASVVHAMAAGKKGAESIIRYLEQKRGPT